METTRKALKGGRIAALDFTKGALVLLMVLYHWLNYFARPDLDYRYLRFLPPSFIFITGFLISHQYLSAPGAAGARVSLRLVTRALKLLLIFAVLNIVRAAIVPGGGLADIGAANLLNVFTIGPAPTEKVISFYILIPISYLLVLSAALLFPHRVFRHVVHLCCAVLLASIAALSVAGVQSQNLEFVTIGMLGALAGFVPLAKINALGRPFFLLALAYICYVAAITAWNTPFALLVVGVCLTLLIIYRVGIADVKEDWLRRHVILLGKYSLFGYIAQIAILQVLSSGLRRVDLGSSVFEISFLLAFALTMITVEVVHRVKARSIVVDRLYKAAFA